MIELLLLYIGFTTGMCLMDYVALKENYYLHLYKYSFLHITLAIIFAPLVFPIHLIVYLKSKLKF